MLVPREITDIVESLYGVLSNQKVSSKQRDTISVFQLILETNSNQSASQMLIVHLIFATSSIATLKNKPYLVCT